MTFNKKILAAAIVGGLFAAGAQAAVVLDADPSTPVTYASELRIPSGPGGLLLTNGGDLDLETSLGFSLSAGQVLYARVECPTNIRFAGNTTVTASSGTVGSINGLPGNVITFSITAAAGNPSPTNATTTLTIDGDRTITSTANGACSYSLYDTPSQAQAGGTAGRIYTVSDQYLAFARSYAMVVSPIGAVSNVEASPSFSRFTGAVTGSTARGALGQVFFGTRAAVTFAVTGQNVAQPLLANGNQAGLADILDGNSSHTIVGDFSAAANADGSFDGDALSRVYFSNSAGNSCANVTVPASEVTASGATFNIGSTAVNGLTLCYAPRSTLLIPESTYTQTFNAVSADTTAYTVSNIGPLNHGSITRNGTSLQAPFVQVPAGWLSRIVLTNTGSVARPYTITAQTETGVTATAGTAATGTIPARGTIVLNSSDIATFTGATRGTFNVSIAAPNTQVQGLYQIVNGATGSISNETMTRPGQN